MENPMMAGGGGSGGGGGGGGGILDFDPHHHHHHHQLHHLVSHLSAAAAASPSDDDDDPTASAAADDENGHGYGGGGGAAASRDGAKKGGSSSSAPWQRMKWTDDIVRLLIRLVALVGDDPAVATESDGAGCSRRKPHGGGGGGGGAPSSSALQKKGKWKTISRLMLERGGCRVSPQQCEDKFNDLNKRYKRLNEILGRGTSCRVVENPSLLDSLPHVTAKGKDDVRKILSSKHLFYREMCAYHNGQRIPSSACHAADLLHPPKPSNDDHGQENDHGDDNIGDDDEDDDDDDEEENDDGDDVDRKRGFEGFNADVGGIPPSELREWFKKRALHLLEERVGIQAEGFEIEKRRFKWQRFKSKKDRELERSRLENERMMLENERMLMLVRQREYELNSKPEEASGGGYRMEMGRVQ